MTYFINRQRKNLTVVGWKCGGYDGAAGVGSDGNGTVGVGVGGSDGGDDGGSIVDGSVGDGVGFGGGNGADRGVGGDSQPLVHRRGEINVIGVVCLGQVPGCTSVGDDVDNGNEYA